MKTICFDLRALQIGHQNRGIGMHVRSILENLPESKNQYIFYCFKKNDPIKTLGIKTKVNYKIVQTPTINTALDSPRDMFGIFRLVFHRFLTLKKYRPDVFVQFDFMLGAPRWQNTKVIVVGYDLIPLIMKNDYLPSIRYTWSHSVGIKAKIRTVLRSAYYRYRYHINYKVYGRADKVVCISQFTASSFENYLNINRSSLVVAPLAAAGKHKAINEGLSNQIKKSYVFYIGGTDKRKSVKDIVYAFNITRGRGRDIALVLAGNEFRKLSDLPDIEARNAILESPYRDDIHLVGFVTDSEKRGFYKNAHAFVFTSSFEGFGLPVIEAMAEGCPVISYKNSSIPEVAGDAAMLVATGNYVEVALKLESLFNERSRKLLISKGIERSKRFTWERSVNILQDAMDH